MIFFFLCVCVCVCVWGGGGGGGGGYLWKPVALLTNTDPEIENPGGQ